jgi:hypothetical protein
VKILRKQPHMMSHEDKKRLSQAHSGFNIAMIGIFASFPYSLYVTRKMANVAKEEARKLQTRNLGFSIATIIFFFY